MKLLLGEEELRQGVRRLAAEITSHYAQRPLTLLGVMTGSVVFLADLMRLLEMPLRVGVVHARSYRGGATSPSDLAVQLDGLPDVVGRDILLVDDIFDTGGTLTELTNRLARLGPASLRTAVLLLKRGRAAVSARPDHVVFEIPDEFVVGYGLDFRDSYRNLPYVAALEPAEIDAGAGE